MTFTPTLFVRSSEVDGYHFFLILSQITYCLALISLLIAHYHETPKHQVDNRLRLQLLAIALLAFVPIVMITVNGGKAMQAFSNLQMGPTSTTAVAKPLRKSVMEFGVFDPQWFFNANKEIADEKDGQCKSTTAVGLGNSAN